MKGKNKLVLARGIVRESLKEDVAKTKINMIIGACLLSISVPFVLAFWSFVSINSYKLDQGCPCSNSCIDINGNRIVGAAVFYTQRDHDEVVKNKYAKDEESIG